jgi:diphosphomevalonate decarboxylase
MSDNTATAVSCSNIAFIKYWGNRDEALRLPVNASLSMNLDGLFTQTSVTFDSAHLSDSLDLNNAPVQGPALNRVVRFLDIVRGLSRSQLYARVTSSNNFPIGAGIASSAAAFAALALAASTAAGLQLSEPQLSRLARRGSGSACRSIPGGFVEWQPGATEEESFAFSIAPASHWDLVDCIAVLASGHKSVGSTEGHAAAPTSPLQPARVADTPRRMAIARRAILDRDFPTFAEIVEADSNLMHAVMMTSQPALFYWEPASLQLIKTIPSWRKDGLQCCYTLDAGPNVHVLCPKTYAAEVTARLAQTAGVQYVLTATAGPAAHLIAA